MKNTMRKAKVGQRDKVGSKEVGPEVGQLPANGRHWKQRLGENKGAKHMDRKVSSGKWRQQG